MNTTEIKRKGDHYVLIINGEEIAEGSYEDCVEEREDWVLCRN